ncbi:penicillin-binding protein 1A [Taylorella equigenitalis]|uniref:Penicillin-binding protein 1A n=2 Tax=Taylorella equigenitalis TaxID=29575 RepID=A0A654KG91_TAYEM|nr:PBP1A family penicillin-binding protein [Taylorella equigenitalis]ADU91452.1 Multimodular transpeptidase-transglycosylase [Taylorella equigenitalis MCE9]AFN36538.1 penicillin-binding protein 1a [Taylorella equigenitalis ATCC 35865]ASY38406.1 penicillin-binding protein [Taylorella equigenitalis]ASY39938.1 penicillin-binding protein [Taylorella equigenitalis]KGK33799.1 penicillin-binding protein [Taylorella equigenitalis]
MSKKVNTTSKKPSKAKGGSFFSRYILKPFVFLLGLGLCFLLVAVLAIKMTWSSLPDLNAMTEYKPRLPMYVYSSDGVLLGEYGDERRNVLNLQEIPLIMRQAILSAEDDGFYHHGGVDWKSMGRAVLANFTSGRHSQGASTITMQVARNFYLSSEKKLTRKFYELLLTYKIEQTLTKDQILELYMNQIYLGHRSYGFAAAARTYFNKSLSDITLAEAAALATIPKSPSRTNPRTNLKAVKIRQKYVLGRMVELGYITQKQMDDALKEPLVPQVVEVERDKNYTLFGQYVSETARQLIYSMYGENTYGRGLKVVTTVKSDDQRAAYKAVRNGVMSYTRRKPYPGPAGNIDLPAGVENDQDAMVDILSKMHEDYPDNDELIGALVLSASPSKVTVMRNVGEVIELEKDQLKTVQRALKSNADSKVRIKRGSVVYLEQIKVKDEYLWSIINLPIVQGSLIAMDPKDGAIKAMIGGFDFTHGGFNRTTQAWRQPGSTFKPFVYAAAIEKGLTPESNISDQPFVLSGRQTGGKPWTPKNYGNSYTVSQTLRRGLYKSKNMVSIRVLKIAGADYTAQFLTRMGFDMKNQPPKGAYLTMALGAGSVTPLQMASSYSIFANGGYRINPYLIDYVEDLNVQETEPVIIMKARPIKAGDEANRAIDARTAWIMNNLLHGVATSGTGARATAILKRRDLHGKTGTTNRSVDAWFVGYTPELVAVTWLGFDQPTPLGNRETGGGLAMPLWIDFMQVALKDIPQAKPTPKPQGIIEAGGNYYLKEYPPGKAIANVGVDGLPTTHLVAPVFTSISTRPQAPDGIGDLIKSITPNSGSSN